MLGHGDADVGHAGYARGTLEPTVPLGEAPDFMALRTKSPAPGVLIDFLSLEQNRQQNTLRLRALGYEMFPAEIAVCRAYGRQMLRHVTDVFDEKKVNDLRWSFLNWEGHPPFTPPVMEDRFVPHFARDAESWAYAMRREARWEFNTAVEAWRSGVPVEETPVQFRENWDPKPEQQPYGVSDEGAEQYVADWMKYLGVRDAEVTSYGNDGGIDVLEVLGASSVLDADVIAAAAVC